jgi:tRNA pseudouridine55 synthase
MRAVAVVRARAGGPRTGHAGTLDPLATGVLVVALGRATKSIDRFMDTDKRYRTRIDLSAFTTTDDREGERDEVTVESPPDPAAIRAALATLTGSIEQRPPAFSAVKIGGRRAYKLARRGEDVAPAPRVVAVHAIELAEYAWPFVTIDVHCGKGVYIRSLARDLGRALGTGGHCDTLRRTAVGPFTEAMAIALDDVPEPLVEADLIPLERALAMVGESPRTAPPPPPAAGDAASSPRG